MSVKSDRCSIGVHVKGIGRESGNIWAGHLTAKRQHQAIVGQDLPSARGCDGYLLICDVDRLNLGGQMAYAYRIEHLAEGDRDVAEIDLVIADTNVVIGVAVDEQDLYFATVCADLVKFASCADSGPQTCKSATEHEDTRHLVHPEVK